MSKGSLRDADRSRESILDAAEEQFAQLGYERVSLGAIAERAGVSRGLPSYFFVDKENLYRTVMERAATRNRRAVLDVVRSVEGNEPHQIISTLIDRYIDYLAENPRVVRLLQWEALEPPRSSAGTSGVPRRVFLEASKLVSERTGTNRIGGIDVDDLLLSIVSLCLYPFQAMPRKDTKQKSFVQKHKRNVSAIVLRAIGGKT
jgi:TetR/AcrR family transcriptional regulator